MTLPAGARLGPYQIMSPLGAGGMGEVYRATDTRLGREVAIKVLPTSLVADPDRLRRFEQEARAAGVLNHPNVIAVYDVGAHEGAPYVVEELLEGETLGSVLAGGRLSTARALGYALQIVHGLAAAHEKGIVHRDLKPENLFVTLDARLKILDFGLARIVALGTGTENPTAVQTRTGAVLGTAFYMSPEQARGQATDARSDIFSFGVVLYEMLTGRRPFAGDSAVETLHAILQEEPAPFTDSARGLSPTLERLVFRCLEKSLERRFQNARDLGFALESLTGLGEAGGPSGSQRSGGRARSVAVLLFKDLAGDPANAHLGLGLADATITELAAMKSLLVRPTAAILRYRNRAIDPEEAGRELGVEAVVDGSFQRAGSRLRVTVQLIDTAQGRPLWGAKIDTSLDDLFRMQDEVSRKIAEALEVELSSADERRLARGKAPSGRAYELYLKGRLHLSSDTTLAEVSAAMECFEKALEIDAGFALARLGLADAYVRMDFSIDPEGDWFARAQAMCQKALAAEPDLPEGHYLRGRLAWTPRSGWDFHQAMCEFSAAIHGRPGLNEAHHFLGLVLNHLGLLSESVQSFQRAIDIDPDDHYAQVHLALARYLDGFFEEALEARRHLSSKAPTPWSLYQTALCQLHLKRDEEAGDSLERLSRLFPGHVLIFSLRGLIAALEHDVPRAREQAALVVGNQKRFGHFHHAQYDLACIEALLGEKERAVDWLTQAARNGFPCVPFFRTDPWLAALRPDASFQRLLDELERDRAEYSRLYRELAVTSG